MATLARSRSSARRPWLRRILGWIIRIVVGFILLSLLMTVIYRFVPPPVTRSGKKNGSAGEDFRGSAFLAARRLGFRAGGGTVIGIR